MIRLIRLASALVVALSLGVLADESKKPQWQRMLTGEDAKTAEKLKEQIYKRIAKDDYRGSIETATELLALRTKLQGADHYETVELSHQIVAYRKVAELTPERRRGWRAALLGVGEARQLESKNRYAEALPKRQSYLKWCEEVLGEEHPDTATSYNNVAHILDALGKYPEAQSLRQKALDTYRKSLGEEHPLTAVGYNNLGSGLSSLGKPAEALPFYQKALAIRREVHGENHPATATSYNNVASSLNSQAKHVEAQPLYQKALAIRLRVLGETHPDTASSYNNVAANLDDQAKYTEATPFYRKALDIYRKVYGEEDPDTALSYNNLAYNLNDQGKHLEAQPLFQKALAIRRQVLGDDHPATAQSYNSVAANLTSQGRIAEAMPLFQKALAIRRATLGEDHPETAAGYNNIALNLTAQGKHVEAYPLYQKALEVTRSALGESHPDTAANYHNLAANLTDQQKHSEALPLIKKAVEIYRNSLGDEHPSTARGYGGLAVSLTLQGEYGEAQVMCDKALAIYRTTFGDEHPSTASIDNEVGLNLHAQRKYAEAQPLLEKSLAIRRKLLGEEHPETATSYNNVAFNLVSQGKSTQAEEVLGQATHCYEASRLAGATGVDRAALAQFNPRLLLAVLQQSRNAKRAWENVELALARGLLDQQATDYDPVMTPDERAEQTTQRQRIAALQPRILALATKVKRTDAELAALEALLKDRQDAESRLAALDVVVSQRRVVSTEAIVKAIPADSALVFWVDITGGAVQEHWACAIRSNGDPRWERLPGTGPEGRWLDSDRALREQLRTALAQSAPKAEVEAIASRLRAQRFGPLLKHLDGVKILHVVPVGDMSAVPVELLLPDRIISYVQSGTFLARGKTQPPPQGRRMLVLGDPTFTRPGDKPEPPKPLPPGGLLMTQIIPGSAADNARLIAGDVLLKYGKVDLTDLESLKNAIASNEKATSVSLRIWRETVDKPFVRDVPPGRLGVVLAREPAPLAIANRRKTDTMLQAVNRGGWKDLPGSRVETDRLHTMFGENCLALTDADASEQALESLRQSGELAKFRYLHFATHGEGNSAQAFQSAIILAQDKLPREVIPGVGGPTIDGQLSAVEVLKFWKLDAELVTLSACETAVGRVTSGDGSLGFAQAFLHAGSRAVCLSLWKVDDTATALLMDRFYQNLLGKREGLTKPMGKATALDEAKRWLRGLSGEETLALTATLTKGVARAPRGEGETRGKDVPLKLAVPSADPKGPPAKDSKPFEHPKYWAAFVLIGDPN
jgi:tetratricopeptide (TPR) repeat protein/Tfp pilus assembly protein PilN